ncbi:MAG: hypothetical protein QOH84_816, partial [Kribbellaceae bacterium]|nr:hypothetical protein [Kribbellaceae bacterium]
SLDEDEDWDVIPYGEAVLLRRFNGGESPAEMDETGAIWADYRLIAPAGYRFIWAAHALLDCSIGTKLDIPPGTDCRLYLDTPPPTASANPHTASECEPAANASRPAAPAGGATSTSEPHIPAGQTASTTPPATPAGEAASASEPVVPGGEQTGVTPAHSLATEEPRRATDGPRAWVGGEWPGSAGVDLSVYGPTDGTATGAVLPDCPAVSVVDGDLALTFRLSCPGQPVSVALWRNLGGYPAEAPYRSLGVEPMLGKVFGLDEAGPGDAAVVPESGELTWRLVVSARSV